MRRGAVERQLQQYGGRLPPVRDRVVVLLVDVRTHVLQDGGC